MERSERAELQRRMVQLADGDRAAFHPVYQALWPLIRQFTARLLPSGADAEDAAQEALVKVFRHANDFDAGRDVVAWALGIAAYECMTMRKRAARRREEPPGTSALDERPTPEEQLVERDLHIAVEAVLGTLRPDDRAVILSALTTTRGARPSLGPTLRKRLQRALERLRSTWKQRHGAE